MTEAHIVDGSKIMPDFMRYHAPPVDRAGFKDASLLKQATYSVRVADVTAVPETTESPLPDEPVAHLRGNELPKVHDRI